MGHEVGASTRGGLAGSPPPDPSARPADRGFTLLELVVTLFVLGLATAIVVPAIGRGTEGIRVRAEVAGFSAFLRRAREESVTTRTDLAVTVDPAARLVLEETADNQVRARHPLPERITIEADPPAALTVYFSPLGFSTGGTFHVSGAGGVVYRVSVDPLTGRVLSRREPTR